MELPEKPQRTTIALKVLSQQNSQNKQNKLVRVCLAGLLTLPYLVI